MKIRLLAIAFSGALAVAAFGGNALAAHEHFLVTPGTCVEDIASGQTSIGDPEHGGFHRFHNNVHTGTPGAGPLHKSGKAPVIVDKVGGNPDNAAACAAALGD